MANIDGFGVRTVWSAWDEFGKQYFFMYKCDYNEAITSGHYFISNPVKPKEEVVIPVAASPIPTLEAVEEVPAAIPNTISSDIGIKRRKAKEDEGV